MDKYHLRSKGASTLLETVSDSDPRLSQPDAMKNLLKSAWDAAVAANANPIEMRVGANVGTDLMAELVTEWYPGQEAAELCSVYGEFLVRFDPSVDADTAVVY